MRCELFLLGQGTTSPALGDPLVRLQSSLFTRARYKHRVLLLSQHSPPSHAGEGRDAIHSWLLGAHPCASGRCSSGSFVVLCPYTLENGKDGGAIWRDPGTHLGGCPGFCSWCDLHGGGVLVGPVVDSVGTLSTSAPPSPTPSWHFTPAALCPQLSGSCQPQVKPEVWGELTPRGEPSHNANGSWCRNIPGLTDHAKNL